MALFVLKNNSSHIGRNSETTATELLNFYPQIFFLHSLF